MNTDEARLYERRADGASVCRVCQAAPHQDACPVLELDGQIRELLAHLGMFVAAMRETIETVERLLTDRPKGD